MKCQVMLFFILLCCLVGSVVVDASAADEIVTDSGCAKCHGMPPLSASDPGAFNPGAHGVHKSIGCGECHVMDIERHVDGRITIQENLNYSEGGDIAWPGNGSGTCIGRRFMKAGGCHQEIDDMECLWIPGKICRPTSTP